MAAAGAFGRGSPTFTGKCGKTAINSPVKSIYSAKSEAPGSPRGERVYFSDCICYIATITFFIGGKNEKHWFIQVDEGGGGG
jgi:hypothetical protein